MATCTGVSAAAAVESICPPATSGNEARLWRRLLRNSRRSVWYTTSTTLLQPSKQTSWTRSCRADAVPQRQPRFMTRPSRVASHRDPNCESAIHRGKNSVVGPARGLYAALSIALLFGPAHHSVIHDTCGPAMQLRYPDSAFIYNAANVTA